jgi:hypothetical protein
MNDTRTRRRRPAVWIAAGAVLLVAWAWGLGRLDPVLLDQEAGCPGLLSRLWIDALLGAGTLLAAGLTVRFAPRPRREGVGLAAVVIAALLLQLGLRNVAGLAREHVRVEEAAARADFDPVAYSTALAELGRRIVERVPEEGRIAVIHRPVQPDFPIVYLGPLLYPRLFYLYETAPPPAAVLEREGIGWILDLTQATYRDRFAAARLSRVEREEGRP